MSSTTTTIAHEKFGGQMSNGESLFSSRLRQLLHATSEGRIPFVVAMMKILADIQELQGKQFDVDGALDSGWHPAVASELPQRADVAPIAPPSELERAFLDDMDGLLDYAMRNGIDFLRVVSAIGHDVGMMRKHDWSLEKAEKIDCFLPMVSGWALRNKQVFGDSESETE